MSLRLGALVIVSTAYIQRMVVKPEIIFLTLIPLDPDNYRLTGLSPVRFTKRSIRRSLPFC